MTANDQVQKYYDALIASYDVLVDAIGKGAERGVKVRQQLATDVAKGQREALELGKRLAGAPADAGQFYAAVLEATTAAQGRALEFAQAAYQEAVGASTEARETIQKLLEVNQETTKAALAVARQWASANPMAEVVRKGFEAFTPKAADAKPEKATKAAV